MCQEPKYTIFDKNLVKISSFYYDEALFATKKIFCINISNSKIHNILKSRFVAKGALMLNVKKSIELVLFL